MTTRGFSLELADGALTRVEGVPAIAVCRHGETVVFSDGARLFAVGGDADDGAPIAVRLALPATDGGDPGPKRLTAVALSGVVGGQVSVVAASESGDILEGAVMPTGESGLPGLGTAKLGRGFGRTWQVSLAAEDGAALDVGAIIVSMLPLDRRVP